ncbi:hypothetical protein PLICRDRAFT_318859 [Plicaturopsis crispa FD-325 SS-3]|nr:hypothetical protein PLICRDRAFT_318859 [Plicaturopsis crispa FD-325 SS-3]
MDLPPWSSSPDDLSPMGLDNDAAIPDDHIGVAPPKSASLELAPIPYKPRFDPSCTSARDQSSGVSVSLPPPAPPISLLSSQRPDRATHMIAPRRSPLPASGSPPPPSTESPPPKGNVQPPHMLLQPSYTESTSSIQRGDVKRPVLISHASSAAMALERERTEREKRQQRQEPTPSSSLRDETGMAALERDRERKRVDREKRHQHSTSGSFREKDAYGQLYGGYGAQGRGKLPTEVNFYP